MPKLPRTPAIRRAFRLQWRNARTLDGDIDDELRFHLEMRAAELTSRRGLDPATAHAEALRQFGDVDDARRYMSAMDHRTLSATRRLEHMDAIRQDFRHASRGLRRSPGFAAVVVLALALGIGTTTAIFTLVNAVLLRPLPVSRPEQLVGFGDPTLVGVTNSGSPLTDIFSYPLYIDLRDRTRLVPALLASGFSSRLEVVVPDEMAAGASRPLDTGAEPEHARGRLVSGNFFEVLGVRAVAGRVLAPEDDVGPGAGPVAVISHAYWRRRFGLYPAIVGQTMLVNRTPVTIVGVGPPGFAGEITGRVTDVWIPLTMQPLLLANQNWLRDRNTNWLLMMGRLRPGATPAQAKTEFTTLARRALAEGGGGATSPGTQEAIVDAYGAQRGFFGMPRQIRAVLAMLLVLTGLILLVVGANVANLLLARAASRRTEIGVRLALGASRLRVMGHLVAESVLLGVGAGALALAVVQSAIALLVRQAESSGGINLDVSIDMRVLGFAAVLSLVTAVMLGLVPAARATRVDLASAVRSHARGMTGDPLGGAGRRRGLGQWLVVGQVALSLVLLAAAGLLVRSAQNLRQVDAGVARDELLMVAVDAHTAGFAGDRLHALYAQLGERLQRVPGVRAVSWSQNGMFSGIESAATLQVSGFVARASDDTTANSDQVSAGYFRTIGARLLRGRDIESRDDAGAPRVAVINETMARFYFAGRDPMGQRLRIDSTSYEIVGVSADMSAQSLRAEPTRRFYTAFAQGGGNGMVVFELRTMGDPTRAAAAARRAILAAHPSLRVRSAQPLATLIRESITHERIVALVTGVAGTLALALTALGLYGVMTYATARRTSEFGLRMALGAQPWDVTRMVLRETMTLVLLGAAVGIPAALGAALLLRNQLVGVGLVDPLTLALALAILGTVAAFAGYRPALRAGRVAPQIALSGE